MRGIPSAGKSTKVFQLFKKYGGDETHVFSTDNFWIPHTRAQKIAGNSVSHEDELAEYKGNWTTSKLGFAHQQNLDNFKKAIISEITPIIVDNTNIVYKNFKDYEDIARNNGYKVLIEEPDSPWWNKYRPYLKNKNDPNSKKHLDDFAEILADRNTHGVPLDTIKKMISNWEEI